MGRRGVLRRLGAVTGLMIALTAAAVTIGPQADAAPAWGQSSTCSVGRGASTCVTAPIPQVNHRIYFRIAACRGATWLVWDVKTKKTVSKGTFDVATVHGSVTGMYGTYRLTLIDSRCTASGTLSNYYIA